MAQSTDPLTRREAATLAAKLESAIYFDCDIVKTVLMDLAPADIDVIKTLLAITQKRAKDAGQTV